MNNLRHATVKRDKLGCWQRFIRTRPYVDDLNTHYDPAGIAFRSLSIERAAALDSSEPTGKSPGNGPEFVSPK